MGSITPTLQCREETPKRVDFTWTVSVFILVESTPYIYNIACIYVLVKVPVQILYGNYWAGKVREGHVAQVQMPKCKCFMSLQELSPNPIIIIEYEQKRVL